MTYSDALDGAITHASDKAALDRFLATVPQWRSQLIADLALVGAARGATRPTSAAREQAWSKFSATLPQPSRTAAAPQRRRLVAWWQPAAALAVAIASVFLLLTWTRGDSTPPPSAGFVIEAQLVDIEPGLLRVRRDEKLDTVSYSPASIVVDGFGNTVKSEWLQTGQPLILTSRREDNRLIADRIEVKGTLFGTVTRIDASSLSIEAGGRAFSVMLSGTTKFVGTIRTGANVEVEVDVAPNGALHAREVEIAGLEDDDPEPR